MDFRAKDIDRWHRERGFNEIGYHYVIDLDGTIEQGRAIEKIGAHCKGYNANSIGVCYIGGLDEDGRPCDTRTNEQKESLLILLETLSSRYHIKTILGHRDTSPDMNGDGEITPNEWIKDCPCFDAKKEYLKII